MPRAIPCRPEEPSRHRPGPLFPVTEVHRRQDRLLCTLIRCRERAAAPSRLGRCPKPPLFLFCFCNCPGPLVCGRDLAYAMGCRPYPLGGTASKPPVFLIQIKEWGFGARLPQVSQVDLYRVTHPNSKPSWPGLSRPSTPTYPAGHASKSAACGASWRGSPGQAHWCPARCLLHAGAHVNSICAGLVVCGGGVLRR